MRRILLVNKLPQKLSKGQNWQKRATKSPVPDKEVTEATGRADGQVVKRKRQGPVTSWSLLFFCVL